MQLHIIATFISTALGENVSDFLGSIVSSQKIPHPSQSESRERLEIGELPEHIRVGSLPILVSLGGLRKFDSVDQIQNASDADPILHVSSALLNKARTLKRCISASGKILTKGR